MTVRVIFRVINDRGRSTEMDNLLKKLVGAEGVEPPTSAMFKQRSATELYA